MSFILSIGSGLLKVKRGGGTGASTQRMGRFERVDQGTLFLRAGRNLDRVATNRDLQQWVADREFRSDLYYRLNVFPIRLPAEKKVPNVVEYSYENQADNCF